MEPHHRILRRCWSTAALLLPFLILAALSDRVSAASTWDAWRGDALEVRIRDGGGLAKIPDPATFGLADHPFAPPHPYSGPPPWMLNFLQIDSYQHPQLGTLLGAFKDYAGTQITRTGIQDDILVLELVNNTDEPLVFPPPAPLSFTIGAVPGPGLADTPGVVIDPGPVVPLPAFRPYPEVPYPTHPGNVIGTYGVNTTGGSGGGTSLLIPWTGSIPPYKDFGATYLVLRLAPQFPGAWRLAINFGIYRTVHVGGISEPPASPRGVVVAREIPSPVPSAPSESRFTYRIYNVGSSNLNLTSFSFSNAPAGQIRLIELRDQSGAVIPRLGNNIFGLPRVIPAYDGEESFDTGPYAYTGGSSPVAPWVDVVLGVSPPVGGFSYTVLANYTSPPPHAASSVQWTIAGSSILSPEIKVEINDTDVVSGVSIQNAANVVNEVQGRGRRYTAVIRNIGNQPLNLGVPTFVSANADGEVLPGGTWSGTGAQVVAVDASVTLRFRIWPTVTPDPPDAGPFAIEVRIPSNDLDENPFVIPIEGDATPRLPRLAVVRNARSIPNNGADIASDVTDVVTSTLTYTLRNDGDRELDIASITVVDSENAAVATISDDPAPVSLDAVDPITLAPGATTTFDFDVRTVTTAEAFRARLAIASNSGRIDGATTSTFTFSITDYKSDGGEGRECGFGSPFGFLLLIGGLLLWRRRVA